MTSTSTQTEKVVARFMRLNVTSLSVSILQMNFQKRKVIRAKHRFFLNIAALFSVVIIHNTALAGDTPTSPPKTTIPKVTLPEVGEVDTGGYLWTAPASDPGYPAEPPAGGSIGIQYPPDTETKVYCTTNGKKHAC